MIRNAASKVMWVGRATVFLLGVAVILALLFGVASSAFAHGGNKGFFHLGHKNVTSKVSTLIKRGAGPAAPALLLKPSFSTSCCLMRVQPLRSCSQRMEP